ncbi:MAG: helix-turn-helix transcriptional regulator [Deltaproteobacteria bacterium]|jgi:transcriptional regulator with XRE-family HTH domain|nr:helix-turn-helix transcriptional regulator [Deltaproteobacteria bacterium]
MKRPPAEEMTRMKEKLYRDLSQGNIDIRQATRQMRKILGMSQKEYAQKVADISPRILSEFETGSGNPTLATLEKIALPFGLKVTFLPPESWRLHAQMK